jgi:vitamin B12 transport system substrate-binding protein
MLTIPAAWAANRVISLAPHATELAYAAGMGDVLVGVSAWSPLGKVSTLREF